jgi:hypothetical protein
MGEVTELMLDGILCDQCGGFVSEIGVGYPRTCSACQKHPLAPIRTVVPVPISAKKRRRNRKKGPKK